MTALSLAFGSDRPGVPAFETFRVSRRRPTLIHAYELATKCSPQLGKLTARNRRTRYIPIS